MDERYAPPGVNGSARAAEPASRHAPVFEYFAGASGPRSSALAYYVLIAPILVAALFGVVGLPDYALPAAALTAIAMWWRKRQQKTRPQATLSVARERLTVLDGRGREALNVPLEGLLEVELDTRTIQRVQESTSSGSMPELRFLQSKVGNPSDISRIVLITEAGELPLTEEQISHSYCIESFGQIRRFLRNHGWLPEDERSLPEAATAQRRDVAAP